MKVLLVKPVARTSFVSVNGPDLGFGYLAAHLRGAGIEPAIIDCMLGDLSHEQLMDVVVREQPDVVGFRVFTKDIPSVRQSASMLRTRFPDLLLLAGGPHVSAVPVEAASHLPEIDFLLAGEAEESLPRFLSLLDARRTPAGWDLRTDGYDDIPGLVHRRGGEVHANAPQTIDLATVGIPSWDDLRPDLYPSFGVRARGPYVPIQTSRGCPYRCTFCTVSRINGHAPRLRPVADILRELCYLKERFGIRHFSVIDDNFLGVRAHTEAFLDALIASDLDLQWEASSNGIRLNQLDQDIIVKLERAGCYGVAVAVESGSDRTLLRMRKGLTVREIEHYVAMLRRHSKMHLHGFFILGYPGETLSDLAATVRLGWRLPLDTANFFLFTPHPGTEIYEELARQGKVQDLDFSTYMYEVPTLDLEDVSPRQLDLARQLAYVLAHAKPRVVARLLREGTPSGIACAVLSMINALWTPRRRIY